MGRERVGYRKREENMRLQCGYEVNYISTKRLGPSTGQGQTGHVEPLGLPHSIQGRKRRLGEFIGPFPSPMQALPMGVKSQSTKHGVLSDSRSPRRRQSLHGASSRKGLGIQRHAGTCWACSGGPTGAWC